MISIQGILAGAGFNEEFQRLLTDGNGKIEINITPTNIVFAYTVSEVNTNNDKFKREFERLTNGGYGKIEIKPMGNSLQYLFTHQKKVSR